jgi:hypothetical protein
MVFMSKVAVPRGDLPRQASRSYIAATCDAAPSVLPPFTYTEKKPHGFLIGFLHKSAQQWLSRNILYFKGATKGGSSPLNLSLAMK